MEGQKQLSAAETKAIETACIILASVSADMELEKLEKSLDIAEQLLRIFKELQKISN